ncbi:MAG: 4-oxalomesaconate tautomerase [Chloroflexota bacterium]
MTQRAIPCVLMRGGTSRGPYFKAEDLPSDPDVRDQVLLRVMGSPDLRQIDGLGGATTVTSKVAIVSLSEHPDADIDYLFAQVEPDRPIVDTSPTCGNMLSGVGPFAIEEGIFPASDGETTMRIRNVNTDSIIAATVQTPNGNVTYDGDCAIAGVPGTAAPIPMRFFNITGSKTGKLLPTGNLRDEFDGVEVTCLDVGMPMVIIRAEALGKTANETPADLQGDADFMARLESIRRQAGEKMGFGDVSDSVIPKPALVGPPQNTGPDGGHFRSRYFTPTSCHPSYAVSGSICVSVCAALPGTIMDGVAQLDERFPQLSRIEHPSGVIDVTLDLKTSNCPSPDGQFEVISGGVLRTARRIFAGQVYVPSSVWP